MSPVSPVFGRRVVITRAVHQASEWADALRERGAMPLLYPAITIVPPENTVALDRTLRALAAYDCLVLTSANTAFTLAERARTLHLPADTFARLPVAAIGTTTAEAAFRTLGTRASIVADERRRESLTGAILRALPTSARLLLPQSEIAPPTLTNALRHAGYTVDAITAYCTVRGTGGDPVALLVLSGKVDAITFSSASTVEHTLARLQAEGVPSVQHALRHVQTACLGEPTAAAARAAGFSNIAVARTATINSLIDLLEEQFSHALAPF